MDAATGQGLPFQPADQRVRDDHRHRQRVGAGLRADLAIRAGARHVVGRRPVLPQRAVARVAVLCHVPAAVRIPCRGGDGPVSGLDQGNHRTCFADHGEHGRDRPRRRTVDPHRAMGGCAFACAAVCCVRSTFVVIRTPTGLRHG